MCCVLRDVFCVVYSAVLPRARRNSAADPAAAAPAADAAAVMLQIGFRQHIASLVSFSSEL